MSLPSGQWLPALGEPASLPFPVDEREGSRGWRYLEQLVLVVGEDAEIRVATGGCAAAFGRSVDSLLGAGLFSLIHPDDRATVMSALSGLDRAGRPVVAACTLLFGGGREEACELVLHPYGALGGRPWTLVWVYRGASLVHSPRGAGAGWLDACARRVGAWTRRVRAAGGSVAVVVADATEFDALAATGGPRAGDDLLYAFGRRIGDSLLEPPLFEWLGRERVVLCLPHLDVWTARDVVREAYEDILGRHGAADPGRGSPIGLGLAGLPQHGEDWLGVVWAADLARDIARAAGGGCVVAGGDEDGRPSPRALAGDLAEAIRAQQFRVYYQPIVGARAPGERRVEALVRWLHPRHGLLAPGMFIGLAEQTGTITALTLWVLEEALGQMRAWAEAGLTIGVAVNLSAETLRDAMFPDYVRDLLRRYGVARGQLTLELTETALMSRLDQAAGVLEQLVGEGVRLAIDDFGVGYSSLQYLRCLPVQEIKVDRSFLSEAFAGGDRALLEGIIRLGGTLGLSVVVEGVEHQEMSDWLLPMEGEWGTMLFQGYLYGRPMPADQLAARG